MLWYEVLRPLKTTACPAAPYSAAYQCIFPNAFRSFLCRSTSTSRVSTTTRGTFECSINNGLASRPRILFCLLLRFLFQLFLSLNPFSPSIMINDPVWRSHSVSLSLRAQGASKISLCLSPRHLADIFRTLTLSWGIVFIFFCLGYSPFSLNANAHCGDPRIQLL